MKLVNVIVTALAAGGLVYAGQEVVKQTKEQVWYSCEGQAGSAKVYNPDRYSLFRLEKGDVHIVFNDRSGREQHYSTIAAPDLQTMADASYALCTGKPTYGIRPR